MSLFHKIWLMMAKAVNGSERCFGEEVSVKSDVIEYCVSCPSQN